MSSFISPHSTVARNAAYKKLFRVGYGVEFTQEFNDKELSSFLFLSDNNNNYIYIYIYRERESLRTGALVVKMEISYRRAFLTIVLFKMAAYAVLSVSLKPSVQM